MAFLTQSCARLHNIFNNARSGEIKCQRRTNAEGYTYVEVHVLAVGRTRHVLGSCCPTYSLSAVSCKSREPRCLKLGRHDSRDHEDWIRLVDKD